MRLIQRIYVWSNHLVVYGPFKMLANMSPILGEAKLNLDQHYAKTVNKNQVPTCLTLKVCLYQECGVRASTRVCAKSVPNLIIRRIEPGYRVVAKRSTAQEYCKKI